MALTDKAKATAKRNSFVALAAGAVVCTVTILILSQLGLSVSSSMAPVIELPMRVLAINAIAAVLSVCAFEAFVHVDQITTEGKWELVFPLLAPLAIFGFELLRSRDWSADRKADQFASFRASVLVSAALASAASLPREIAKVVVSACLVVAAAVLPLSSASDDSVNGALSQAIQRSLMVVLTWVIVAIVIDHYSTKPPKDKAQKELKLKSTPESDP